MTCFVDVLYIFLIFLQSNVDITYCKTRTIFLDKIVILVHDSLFSTKVCLVHLK